jgi:hypothetical protein
LTLVYHLNDSFLSIYLFILFVLGKDDIFGEDLENQHDQGLGKSMYIVRALSYCDINKIDLTDLKEIMVLYPEFAETFQQRFRVTFNLKKVRLLFPWKLP